jgi:hypothetical protein
MLQHALPSMLRQLPLLLLAWVEYASPPHFAEAAVETDADACCGTEIAHVCLAWFKFGSVPLILLRVDTIHGRYAMPPTRPPALLLCAKLLFAGIAIAYEQESCATASGAH